MTGRLEGDNIVFCVTDDGVGMDEEKLYNLRKASVDGSTQSANIAAFGVGNVNERIHIYYGENYGLFFKSQPMWDHSKDCDTNQKCFIKNILLS